MPRATPDGMKVCSKCKENKKVEEFCKNPRTADGLVSTCRVCSNARLKAWRIANPEKARAQGTSEKARARIAAWRARNPEKAKAHAARWYRANSEKAKASSAAWRISNPEKVQAHRTSEKERARIAAYRDAWKAANPEKVKAYARAWVEANPEKVRATRARLISIVCPSYAAKALGLPLALVPPELIELKRLQIQIKRELKQQEQCK